MKIRLLICLVIFVCFGASFAVAEEWPQWLGPTRNSVWNEKGIIRQFPKDGPKVLWKSMVSGGFSGPAVAGNKVLSQTLLLNLAIAPTISTSVMNA